VPESPSKLGSFVSVNSDKILTDDVIQKTEDNLKKSCGQACLQTFRDMIPEIEALVSTSSSVGWKTSESRQADLVDNALRQLLHKLTKQVDLGFFSYIIFLDHVPDKGVR
jgi:hypothetical protein